MSLTPHKKSCARYAESSLSSKCLRALRLPALAGLSLVILNGGFPGQRLPPTFIQLERGLLVSNSGELDFGRRRGPVGVHFDYGLTRTGYTRRTTHSSRPCTSNFANPESLPFSISPSDRTSNEASNGIL